MLQDRVGAARDEIGRQYHEAEDLVVRNPMPSVLIGFGVGFGLGVVLTALLHRPEESWAERHLPESLRHAGDRLHQLAESVRDLPSGVAHRFSGRT
jgi:hypothetical protein